MLMLIIGLVLGFWAIPMVLGLIGAGRSQPEQA
jgi:hypothetical protein